MKKAILFFLILSLSFISKAQEAKDSTYSKWAIGAAIAPTYTFYTLSPYSNKQVNKITHKTTVSDGLNIMYSLNNKSAFALGLFFDRLNYTSSIFAPGFSGNYISNSTLINIPIQFNYKLGHNKFTYSLSPGFSVNFSGKIMYFGTIGASVNYKLSDNFSIYLQPEYCYGFTNLKPTNPNYWIVYGYYNNKMEYFKTNIGFYYSLDANEPKGILHSYTNSKFDIEKNLNVPNEKSFSKLAIGASVAPVYTFPSYYWGPIKSSPITLGYALTAKYNATQIADFSLGISYDKLSYKSGDDYFDNTYKYSLLSFPAKIIFKVEEDNFYLGIGPGFSLSILQSNQILPSNKMFNVWSNSSLFVNGSVLLFYNFTACLGYKINNKISVTLQPEYIHALSPLRILNNVPEVDNYLSYFKTNIGFYYSL